VKISEIQSEMENIEVVGRVIDISEKRQVLTRYGPADIATATLKDETGSIHLNLWRQQIDSVREGKMVRIINAFTRVYNDRLELNIGQSGYIAPVGEN
jgi:ssDNA-binding replication factor A large subunit